MGSDALETAPRLPVQELVLVENLKVKATPLMSLYFLGWTDLLQEAADRVVKQALGGGPSKMDLVYSKDGFMRSFATVLNEDSELSAADFDVLLIYLSRDCGAIAYDGRVCGMSNTERANG